MFFSPAKAAAEETTHHSSPTLAGPQALPCTTESNTMSVDNSLSGVLNLTLLRRSSWPNMTEAIEAGHQTEELINQGMHLCFYHRVNCGQLMGAVGKCRALSIHVPPRKAEWGTMKVVYMSPTICRLEDSSLYLTAIPATRSGFFFLLYKLFLEIPTYHFRRGDLPHVSRKWYSDLL